MKTVRDYIRTIPDFPKPGIQFRDVTTLFLDPRGLGTGPTKSRSRVLVQQFRQKRFPAESPRDTW